MLEKNIREFSENINALREFVNVIEEFFLRKWEEDSKEHALGLLTIYAAMEAFENIERNDEPQENISTKPPDKIQRFQNQYKEFFGEDVQLKIEKYDGVDKRIGFKVPAKAYDSFTRAMHSAKKSRKRDEFLYQNSFLNLIGIGEWFFSQILRLYFSKFPDAIGVDEKFFSLKNLQEIGSIEDAKKCLIDTKIENIMRGSFEDWVKFLKENIKLSMGYLEVEEKKLKEAFQRRNLLMHNGGIVNATYFAKVPPALREGVEIDRKIVVDENYLSHAIDLFEKNFILIGSELWKKLEAKNEKRGTLLIDIAFEHLQNERWSLAESLSCFVKKDKGLSERYQLVGQMNYWQAIKWQGRYEEIRQEVESYDCSAKDEIFQICHIALTNKEEAFFERLPQVLKSKKLEYHDLDSWPIFKEMRDGEKYRKFQEENKEEFEASRASSNEGGKGESEPLKK